MRQFQIIFTPVAASELAKMPKELQLNIIGDFRGLPQQVYCDNDSFGKLERNGRILHRFRLGDYRVYFEKHELGVLIHRILNRNTLQCEDYVLYYLFFFQPYCTTFISG